MRFCTTKLTGSHTGFVVPNIFKRSTKSKRRHQLLTTRFVVVLFPNLPPHILYSLFYEPTVCRLDNVLFSYIRVRIRPIGSVGQTGPGRTKIVSFRVQDPSYPTDRRDQYSRRFSPPSVETRSLFITIDHLCLLLDNCPPQVSIRPYLVGYSCSLPSFGFPFGTVVPNNC